MTTKKTVLVLGGGVGGLAVARALRKTLRDRVRIVVVDQSPRFSFAPSYLWLFMGWRQPEQISRELVRLLGRDITFTRGRVESIETKASTVTVDGKQTSYDYLVVALGAELAYDAVPDLFPAAYSFYDLEQALKLRDALRQFPGGRMVVLVSSTPYKCPAAPYEGALLLDYYLRKKGLRDRSEVQIFTPEPQPLPVAGPTVGSMVSRLLEQREISFSPNHRLARIASHRKEVAFENGATTTYDLLVAIPPHHCPGPVRQAGLADERGWVPVDKSTLKSARADRIYALGDITIIPLPSGLPLPKAGVFAYRQAKAAAHNIAAEITGKPPEAFPGEGACFLETGFGKAAYVTGNFYAVPQPQLKLRSPNRLWHWGKVMVEQRWIRGWF